MIIKNGKQEILTYAYEDMNMECNIKLSSQYDTDIKYEFLTFSGGEEHVRLKDNVCNDSIRRGGAESIICNIPYFPYARQDRVCNTGEAHALKVFADLINSCNFDLVEVMDPHSDVVEAVEINE